MFRLLFKQKSAKKSLKRRTLPYNKNQRNRDSSHKNRSRKQLGGG